MAVGREKCAYTATSPSPSELEPPTPLQRRTIDVTQGNAEGTPARARASTRGHVSSVDFFGLRDLRGRRDPRLPSLPASELNGKEGVCGSSPQEGSKIPAKRGVWLSRLVQWSTSTARRGSRLGGSSTTERVAGNYPQFLGALTALRSWGQVSGTNDGWLGPNGSSARPIDAQ